MLEGNWSGMRTFRCGGGDPQPAPGEEGVGNEHVKGNAEPAVFSKIRQGFGHDRRLIDENFRSKAAGKPDEEREKSVAGAAEGHIEDHQTRRNSEDRLSNPYRPRIEAAQEQQKRINGSAIAQGMEIEMKNLLGCLDI